jgi:SRSO17 transposase
MLPRIEHARSPSVANDHARLQAPFDDRPRRPGAGVREDMFAWTKPQIALAQIRPVLDAGAPHAPVLADTGPLLPTQYESASAIGVPP